MFKNLLAVCMLSPLVLLAGCQMLPAGNSSQAPLLWRPFTPAVPLGQAVQEALASSGDPVIAKVQVETQKDQVYLHGFVKKIRQSDLAEQLARQVPGVKQVFNGIIVKP